ncbi:hypothetical protein SteCoe_27683 [Stentor coeruleus]|uniref:Uncharacterized protein n=1 Tax=Stentor coeruleus TaxID=5963 RepID=A0A1R2BA21_9CILI|nr:hypothetical protein SteCoe_27683 [Stentor coeruleus]
MNNLNLGLALSVSGLFLNYASWPKKNNFNTLSHERAHSQQLPHDFAQIHYSFYAACDDASYDFHSVIPDDDSNST